MEELEGLDDAASQPSDSPLRDWQDALGLMVGGTSSDSEQSSSPPASSREIAGDLASGCDVDLEDPLHARGILLLSHQCRHVSDEVLDEQRMAALRALVAPDLSRANVAHHAKTLGVNRLDLRRDLGTLAACAVQVERHVWRHLETKLVEEASLESRIGVVGLCRLRILRLR